MATFKKNIHRAKNIGKNKVQKMISRYPSKYPTPKYMTFIKEMLEHGWEVKLYEAKVSKYVFVTKKKDETKIVKKIRFSNHKPLLIKELEEDCDYYVGVSHKQVSTTEQIISTLLINY